MSTSPLSMRILPDRTRRVIVDRDRGCRFPGCPTTRFVEIHHLTAWADGGTTDTDHQISLCTTHHDGIDRGDHTITGDPPTPDGLTVTNRYGLPIRPPRPHETAPPPGGDPYVAPDTYRPPTGGSMSWHDVELVSDQELHHGHPAGTLTPTTTPRAKSSRRKLRSSGAGLVIISDDLIPWE
jgi:hypothetical protein